LLRGCFVIVPPSGLVVTVLSENLLIKKKNTSNYVIIAHNKTNKGKSGKGSDTGKEKPAKDYCRG
jgi:hypothetical protein